MSSSDSVRNTSITMSCIIASLTGRDRDVPLTRETPLTVEEVQRNPIFCEFELHP
ncbi:MAG: hypothetical protein WCF90_01310 [Methanomicrobiales archaeon]